MCDAELNQLKLAVIFLIGLLISGTTKCQPSYEPAYSNHYKTNQGPSKHFIGKSGLEQGFAWVVGHVKNRDFFSVVIMLGNFWAAALASKLLLR